VVSRLGLEPRTLALKGRSTPIAIICDWLLRSVTISLRTWEVLPMWVRWS